MGGDLALWGVQNRVLVLHTRLRLMLAKDECLPLVRSTRDDPLEYDRHVSKLRAGIEQSELQLRALFFCHGPAGPLLKIRASISTPGSFFLGQ